MCYELGIHNESSGRFSGGFGGGRDAWGWWVDGNVTKCCSHVVPKVPSGPDPNRVKITIQHDCSDMEVASVPGTPQIHPKIRVFA